MDDAVADIVEAGLGVRPRALSALTGGCVGEVYRATLPDGDVVVKIDRRGAGGSLDIEGRMLAHLAAHSALPVPGVVHASPGLLAMEWVENDGRRSAKGEAEAGAMVAALHGVTAERYGFEEDTLIGGLVQPNGWDASWPRFFVERRIVPLADAAERAGALPGGVRAGLDRLCGRIDEVLGGELGPGRPSLIHGDIWSGNVLWHAGRVAAFIDPAVYYADPEVELAFIGLFGTFGAGFWEAYRAERGERAGGAAGGEAARRREAAYRIPPLLVHAVLFGGSYGNAVGETLRAMGV